MNEHKWVVSNELEGFQAKPWALTEGAEWYFKVASFGHLGEKKTNLVYSGAHHPERSTSIQCL